MTQKSILNQVRGKAYSEGFREASSLSYEDAYEAGRERGYFEAQVPAWRFFALFGIGLTLGAMLL